MLVDKLKNANPSKPLITEATRPLKLKKDQRRTNVHVSKPTRNREDYRVVHLNLVISLTNVYYYLQKMFHFSRFCEGAG